MWNLPADGALLAELHLHQPRQSTVKRSINGTLPQGLHEAEASPLMDGPDRVGVGAVREDIRPCCPSQSPRHSWRPKAEQAAEPQMAGPAAPRDPTPSAAEIVAAVPLVVRQLRRGASGPGNGVGDIADSDEENALLLGPLSVSGPGPAPSSFSLKPARKQVSWW